MNLIIFFTSYFIIIASVIGYGSILQKVFNKKLNLEFEYSLLSTILFLIVISFFTHFFLSHNYLHNGVIIIFGLFFFFIMIIKDKKLFKSYAKYILLIFSILFFGLLIAKSHDDFIYYHFPYTYYLTQENLIVGTGNLNHGFRTPSSIFYLNSLFYLPFIKYYSFNIGATLIFGLSNLILIFKLKDDLNKKRYDYIFLLTLLSLLFINVFFYRISEHGTDRSAQILILLLFIEVLSLFRNQVILSNFFSKIFILLGLIISLKAFYVLYLLTLVPILFYLKKQNINKLIKSFLKNFYFYLFIFVGFFLCLVNIFNTGCLIYPVEFTCFTKFDWSLKGEAKIMNDWYELWAKAGAGPNYRIDNPENYIQGFNWVNNWVDEYFFNKMSDFLFGVIFLLSIIYFTFYSKNQKKIKINKKIYGLYLVLLVLLIEWFYNHPSLRYGGYSLIALILFIPSSIYISKFLDKRKIKKKLIILISCCLIIFIGRNINRISYEINKYDYNVFLTPFYSLNENYFRIDKFMKKVEQNYKECKITNTKECLINNEIVIKENGNYLILMKKK